MQLFLTLFSQSISDVKHFPLHPQLNQTISHSFADFQPSNMIAEHEKKRLVLYADDDADDRMLLVEHITKVAPQYTVETVDDGFAALDYLNKRVEILPCLLILDLNMPGMNGKEVMQKLKADTRFQKLQIVIFTTSASPSDAKDCAKYGVDMVTKPLDLDDLKVAADRLLSYCH